LQSFFFIPQQQIYITTNYRHCKRIIKFDKKIKGWYLPSLKNIKKKIYLTQISKVAPVDEEKLLTETALTLEYLVLFPGVVTAL
jgi:hypothetical protein